MNKKMRVFLTIAAALVLVAASIGGTVAYLKATSNTVTNEFIPTSITIAVSETTGTQYTMIPGATIDKDPVVKVTTDVPAWVFVEVIASDNLAQFITYDIDDAWTLVPGETNVYYLTVNASANEQTFGVLAGDEFTVKTDFDSFGTLTSNPTLQFKAYAIQSDYLKNGENDVSTAAGAWALAH